MEAALAGTSQEQRETKPEPAETAAPGLPLVPDDVLDQILANALAQQALNAMLRDNDIEETIDLLDREEQRKAAAEFVVMARKQQEEQAAAPEPEEASGEFAEVSDDLVLFIVGEAGLRDELRDIMRQKGLAGEPTELPFETLRSVVAVLMEGSGAARQPGAARTEKRRAWWQFWK